MHHLPTLAILGLTIAALLGVVIITGETTGSAVVKGTFYQEKLKHFSPNTYTTERKTCYFATGRGCCTQQCNKRFEIRGITKFELEKPSELEHCIYYCYWGIDY
ncbi:MAG: hypothetical protein AABX52_03960 [Nanoarchaeota archaeon]